MTDLDVRAELSLGFDGLRKDMHEDRQRAERVPPQPLEVARTNGAAFPNSGVLALNMGGPQQGRVWRIRSIAVGGLTPTTTEAGRADVFIAESAQQVVTGAPGSGSQPGAGGVIFASGLAPGSLGAWRDQSTVLPNVAFYGLGDLSVLTGQQLWVVFSSGTATDQLIANVRIDDYETAAYAMARRV